MDTEKVTFPALHLVGVKTRTNNLNEFNPATAKISSCLEHYFENALFDRIPNRKNPGTTLCVYTEYESDETGEYTYFVGEEVTTLEATPGFDTLTIPAQHYLKFTLSPGPLPDIVIDAWQKIWQMGPEELGAPRAYNADFEVYDERAMDPDNGVLDIYLGLQE